VAAQLRAIGPGQVEKIPRNLGSGQGDLGVVIKVRHGDAIADRIAIIRVHVHPNPGALHRPR